MTDQVLSDIRDIALGSGDLQAKLDAIVAIVDGEIGPSQPSIVGDFAGTVPAGETWKITGDVNLTGDLIVEGTLTGVDTFTIEGNGHQIVFQHGGRADLAGKQKTAWVSWGDPVAGWVVGDSLVVAPTAVGDYTTKNATWQGDWSTTLKPSEDVTLIDGSVARPEVANVSQAARIHNVSRVHFHDDAGVQTLANVAVVDSGVPDLLDHYPIHFHLMGEASRGSTLTDVVVQGGKNHSFVPHSSSGITHTRCVAVNGTDDSFWWNRGDATDDLLIDRCAVIGQSGGVVNAGTRNTGFRLATGSGCRIVGSVATGVGGTQHSGGFLWPESGGSIPMFDCVAHNNYGAGAIHYTVHGDIERLVTYHNGGSDFANLTYRSAVQVADLVAATVSHKGVSSLWWFDQAQRYDRLITDSFQIGSSPAGAGDFSEVADSQIGEVVFDGGSKKRMWRFTDCGLAPPDFSIISFGPETVLSIVEAGTEVHRFEIGAWV